MTPFSTTMRPPTMRTLRSAAPAPATGPAYVKFGGRSAPFYFEGSGNKVGAAYFVSALAPDLSTVRVARSADAARAG